MEGRTIMDILDDMLLWDRVAGVCLQYVQNYTSQKAIDKMREDPSRKVVYPLNPTYKVDYEIDDETLDFIAKNTVEEYGSEKYWVNIIATNEDINDLPELLKNLVVQCLPKFFEVFPFYKGLKCLELRK